MRSRETTIAIVLSLLGLIMFGEYRTVVADDRATVAGVVRFEGPRPKRKRINLTEKGGKPTDCHHLHKNGLLNENLIVGEKGQLANVFVYVSKGLPKKTYPAPKQSAVLDQDHCMFRPRVQGVLVGQELLMRNSDPLVHNVRSLSLKNRPFNIAQPAETPDRKKVFTKREQAITIQCDFHPWMKAFVFVMDHPFFAVTDKKGQFKIAGLPTGEYTLTAWHEELGEQETKVTVAATRSTDVGFEFNEEHRSKLNRGERGTSHENSHKPIATNNSPKRRFVKMWKPEDLADDLKELAGRSPRRGREVFEAAACAKCHVIAGKGTRFGPDLTDVAKRFKGPKLLEQILKPSNEIHKDFQTYAVTTSNGKTVVGLVVKEDADNVHVLPNPLKPKEVTVLLKSDIKDRFKSQLSTMPEGLLMTFKREEILDLLSYLQSGGSHDGR